MSIKYKEKFQDARKHNTLKSLSLEADYFEILRIYWRAT